MVTELIFIGVVMGLEYLGPMGPIQGKA